MLSYHLLYSSLSAVALLTTFTSAQCNTNQNPYCAGEPRFEQLCCQYPAVCYWSNRNGDPACCRAGQDCRADGGPGTSIVPVPVTYVQVTTAYATSVLTQPQQTVTYVPPATTQQFTSTYNIATPAVVVASNNPAASPNGVFVTVTQVSNAPMSSRYGNVHGLLLRSFSLSIFVVVLTSM